MFFSRFFFDLEIVRDDSVLEYMDCDFGQDFFLFKKNVQKTRSRYMDGHQNRFKNDAFYMQNHDYVVM